MEKKHKQNFLWVALFLLATIWIIARHNQPVPFQQASGLIFGTVYNITYQHTDDLKAQIDSTLKAFDGSLSPFNDTATITRVNRNEPIVVDTLFRNVFLKSMEVSKETDGAFDITIAPLVNAWGFGFKKGTFPDEAMVDSLRQLTDYRRISLTEEGTVEKDDERMQLTCSAVAKGYAVDIIGQLLHQKGAQNFKVEIGGEVVVCGTNPRQQPWRIGISKPVEDSLSQNQELQTILHLSNVGIATSGNYRNFYYRDGKKYAHTIDPRTGYPVEHSLLSATVIADDCMSADAYATAFMVMGLEKAEALADSHPDIEAYFIYADEEGNLQTYATEGMKKYMNPN